MWMPLKRPRRSASQQPRLVASWPRLLRWLDGSFVMARSRLLPRGRRSWRCKYWQHPLCPTKQLAWQRKPRQGSPSTTTHQTKIRQQNLLGRSYRPSRHDGLWSRWSKNHRFCLWSHRHLAPRKRHLLGQRKEWLAKTGSKATAGLAIETYKTRLPL